MEKKLLKFTFNKPEYIQKAIDLFTDARLKNGLCATKGNKTFEFSPSQSSKLLLHFCEGEGYTVTKVPFFGRTKKELVDGYPVMIDPYKGPKNGYDNGVVVSIVCAGKTEWLLRKDIDQKHALIDQFMVANDIAEDRVCNEVVICELR